MPWHNVQQSFAGGEISPSAQARVDVEKYKGALLTCRNFIPGPHGEAYNRPGTFLAGVAKYNDRKSRVIPFIVSSTQAYILEVGDQYIRFYRNSGLILADPNKSAIPSWNTNNSYTLNDYVFELRNDFTTHLYQSLKYANVGNDPQSSPTFWTDLGQVTAWSGATTYVASELVSIIRPSDGTQRIFKNKVNPNLNHNPLNATPWVSAAPAVWDATKTYNTGDYVSYTDQFGNVSIYINLRNSNINHNIFTEGLWWQFWNGPLTWSNGSTYNIGDYVIRQDGGGIYRAWQSLISSNVGNDPNSNVVYWQEILGTFPYEIVTPYAVGDIPTLKYTQSADTLYLVHPGYAPMTLQRTSDNNWTFATYNFKNGPFMFPNTDATKSLFVDGNPITGQTVNLYANGFNLFDPKHVGAYFKLNMAAQGTQTFYSVGAGGPSGVSSSIRSNGSWKILIAAIQNSTVVLQKSIDGGATWTNIQTFTGDGTTAQTISTFGTETLSNSIAAANNGKWFYLRVSVTHGGSDVNNITLTADNFTQEGIVQVLSYINPTQVLVKVLTDVASSGLNTLDWSEGSWSTYRGWPSCVTFTQDRLSFARTPSEPETIWETKTSNYVDFGISDPLIDSDSININLLGRQVNPIESLISFLSVLVAFTSSSEYSIESTSGGALTPTTVYTKLQGMRGTSTVDPILIGDKILFIEPLGSAIREMSYQYFTGILPTQNVSLISDHLFKSYSIVEMVYQQEPDSLVWMVRSDGALLCLTYMPEQEVLAWSRHDTVGSFESIASIPGSNCNEVWFEVQRGSLRFIERMVLRTQSTSLADQYFVDCGITYSGGATASIAGYDHLNGMTVNILANGAVLPQQTVTNGTISVPAGTTEAQIGLPIVSDIETLNPDYPTQTGSAQGKKYRISRMGVRLLNTAGIPKMGPDLNTLAPVAFDDPTVLFTGFRHPPVDPPQTLYPHVAIRQTDPLPITVLAIQTLVDESDT